MDPGEIIVSGPVEIIPLDEFAESVDGFVIVFLVAADETIHVVGFFEFGIETENGHDFDERQMESSLNEVYASKLIVRFQKVWTKTDRFRVGFFSLKHVVSSSLAERIFTEREKNIGVVRVRERDSMIESDEEEKRVEV